MHVFVLMAVYWAEYSFDSLQRRLKKNQHASSISHKAGKTKLKKTKREEGKKNIYCWHKIELFGFNKGQNKCTLNSQVSSHDWHERGGDTQIHNFPIYIPTAIFSFR